MQQDINLPTPSGLSFLTALRIMSGFVACVAALTLVWAIYDQVTNPMMKRYGLDGIDYIKDVVLAIVVIVFLWVAFCINSPKSQVRMKYTALGGALLGSIGFFGGFIGPILLDPTTAQGPLVGIFITGPLGLVVGAVGGYIYALFRGQESVSR